MTWKIVWYENLNGSSPVRSFVDSLDPKTKSRVISTVDLLEKYGVRIGRPYSKKLTGYNLWELRILGQANIRIFYVAVVNQTFVLLHGFIKKKQKTDKKEIKTAVSRLQNYKNRA